MTPATTEEPYAVVAIAVAASGDTPSASTARWLAGPVCCCTGAGAAAVAVAVRVEAADTFASVADATTVGGTVGVKETSTTAAELAVVRLLVTT